MIRCAHGSGAWRRAGVSAAWIAALAGIGVGRPAAAAEGYAWLWANSPTRTFEYTPHVLYQHNSEGERNTVQRAGTGVYRLYMPGLAGEDGNVQVTAYGSDASYCKVAEWRTIGDEQEVEVRCFTSAGVPVDTWFTAFYVSHRAFDPANDSQAAYLLADDPTSPSYTPDLDYQFNSEGGVNTITRGTTGVYTVTLEGMDEPGGNILVTAYGTGSERCKVGGWYNSGGDTVATVYCHTVSGARVDTRFTLSYVVDTAPAGAGHPSDALLGAYTRTGGSTGGTVALPSTHSWSWMDQDPVGYRRRTGVGQYRVTLEEIFGGETTVIASAYGSDAAHCKIASWGPDVYDANITVRCFDASGNLVDSMFTLLFQTSEGDQQSIPVV